MRVGGISDPGLATGTRATRESSLTRLVDRGRADDAFRERSLSVAVIVLVLLPLVVSAFALLGAGSRYHPFADQAIIEMNVRDIFGLPLLGPYSRFGWFHPGPALYYALALPYWLTGGSSASLAFAALCINAAAIAGILLIARRRGGLALLLPTAIVVEILVLRLGTQFMRDVWNPSVTVLPFLLLAFLTWTMSCGDRWTLPVSALVASLLVQAHVGYAAPVATLLVFGVGGLAWSERRRHRHAVDARPDGASAWHGWIRVLCITAGVVVVMWIPPLVQQFTDEPGNLGKVFDFFQHHGQERSATQAWHVLSAQFGAWPDWLSGHTNLPLLGAFGVKAAAPFPVVLVLLGAASLLAWSKRRFDALRLDLMVGVLVAASFFAVTRIVGDVWYYLVKWLWAVGALAWIAILVSLAEGVRSHAPEPDRHRARERAGRAAVALGLAALVVLSVIGAAAAATAGTPDARESRRIETLTNAVQRALATAPAHGVVEIRMWGASDLFGGAGSVWTGAGIADLLEGRGVDVRVAHDLGFAYGDDRVVDEDERVRLVVMPVDAPDVPEVRALGTWRRIARAGSMHLFARPG
jgi:hypothetical protein